MFTGRTLDAEPRRFHYLAGSRTGCSVALLATDSEGPTNALVAIEHRAARLAARAREHGVEIHSRTGPADRDRAYVEAFEAGRPPPRPPRAHDLERYAAEWAPLVADDPDERAQLARAIGSRHRLPRERVPAIRATLGLDSAEVRDAYERRYGRPLDEIFREGHRLRWTLHGLSSSLERLPPFWLTTVLVVTVSLPVSLLGLPVAAAEIGPLPALALLAIVGALMSITMAALGEATTRSAGVRYRRAFLGGLANDLVGGRASAVLTGTAGVRTTMMLLAGWIGLSITLTDLTDVPREIWAGVILAAVILMLLRGSKVALSTVAVFGIAATVLVLVASVLALAHAGPGDLSHADVPLGGGPAELDGTLGAALGVILMQYIGSVYLIGIHRAAASSDPAGRDLAAGAFVGTILVTLIVGLWLVAASAAVPAADLHGISGTAMGPLVDEIGPAMGVIGGLAALLLLGMNVNRASTAVHQLALERLPERRWRQVAALVPVLLVFAVAETLLDLGDVSFTSVLTICGLVTNFIVGGVFPMLLVLAARRRAELVPARTWRWIGAPPVVWAIVAGCLGALVFVGLAVLDDWGSRSAALAAAALGAATVLWADRRGSFRARCVVELIDDRRGAGEARWALVSNGRPLDADVELGYEGAAPRSVRGSDGPVENPDALRTITVRGKDGSDVKEIAIWGQRVDADGAPVPIAATATVRAGRDGAATALRLDPDGRSPDLELPPGPWSVELLLAGTSGA